MDLDTAGKSDSTLGTGESYPSMPPHPPGESEEFLNSTYLRNSTLERDEITSDFSAA